MKSTPSHHNCNSIQTKQKDDQPRRKNNSALKFFILVARKVFRIRERKPAKQDSENDVIKNSNQFSKQYYSTDTSTGSKSSMKFRSSDSYASSSSMSGQIAAVNFSFEEIYKATRNFSLDNKIGEGGFGTVYRAKLKDGSIVAVKRANEIKFDRTLLLEFKNEIMALSKIEHLNLVKLYGYLEHGDERMIVVEYVSNGTLREHLDGQHGYGLEIAERLDIAIDVAHAITYLHTYADIPIIHRDIKATNILVTEKLRAKVADFGFARVAAEDPGATHISTQIKGTAGYLDPEYLRTYQLTEKSDVYSFGVVLVELMTGRYPIETKKPQKERLTIRWAMQKLKEGDAVLVMDPRLRRSPSSVMVVEKVLKLAHECLASVRHSRPSMKKCAEVLWGIRKDFKEQASSPSPTPTSHNSASYPHRDVKKSRYISFGIEDDTNNEFISA